MTTRHPKATIWGVPDLEKPSKNKRNSMVSAIFPKCHRGCILGAFYIPRAPTASPREHIIHPKCHQRDPGSLQIPSMCPKCIPGVFKMTPELQKEAPNLPNHVPKDPKPHSPVPVQGPAAGGVALKIYMYITRTRNAACLGQHQLPKLYALGHRV